MYRSKRTILSIKSHPRRSRRSPTATALSNHHLRWRDRLLRLKWLSCCPLGDPRGYAMCNTHGPCILVPFWPNQHNTRAKASARAVPRSSSHEALDDLASLCGNPLETSCLIILVPRSYKTPNLCRWRAIAWNGIRNMKHKVKDG